MNETRLAKLARPLIVLATLIWGSTFVIMKNTLETVPTFYLLAFRFTAGAVILGVVFWRKLRLLDRSYLVSGAVMGSFLFAAYTTQTLGLSMTTPGKNAFLTAVYCVIVPFLYWMISHRPPDRYHVAAAFLCITGVGLVSLSSDLTLNLGDGLTLVSGLVYACHIIAVARNAQGKDIFLLTAVQFAVTAAWSWVFALLFEDFPTAITPGAMGSLVYLAVAATAGALLFQNVGQKYTPPATAAVLLALEAPFGVAFSVLTGSERLTGPMVMGFLLIFVAILCSETKFSFLRRKAGEESNPEPCQGGDDGGL